MTQRFPEGADPHPGRCASRLCRAPAADVVAARLGATWREALEVMLCAECLADMAAGADVIGAHVFALCDDGLFREVRYDGPATTGSARPAP